MIYILYQLSREQIFSSKNLSGKRTSSEGTFIATKCGKVNKGRFEWLVQNLVDKCNSMDNLQCVEHLMNSNKCFFSFRMSNSKLGLDVTGSAEFTSTEKSLKAILIGHNGISFTCLKRGIEHQL